MIDDRFEIGERAASGAMGEVFRALDRATSERVAIKVLLASEEAVRRRFAQEAMALSELRHPGIVRYIAHGETAEGEAYLALEWLEGEDLASRLSRGRLAVDETVVLALHVAEALGAAHARGVIHRDLKPSNLFLVNGAITRPKVLDFGIAVLGGVTRMTRTGVMVGTPAYMTPEQALPGEPIHPATDVFSLGSVLFECLTGERAFVGTHLMALLTKIVFEEVPRVREFRPEVPAALDALIASMLEKKPSMRPRDGAAVAEALASIEVESLDPTVEVGIKPSSAPPRTLTRGERRLLSVVLIAPEEASAFDKTEVADAPQLTATEVALRDAADAHGGRLQLLSDGSLAVTIAGAGIATDLAIQAARCALALRSVAAGRSIALATGRGEAVGRRSVSDAIDRATRMVMRPAAPFAIAIDQVTAALLDARFDVRGGEAGLELHGEQDAVEGARTLLGKPTVCVGREREIGTLSAIWAECVEEPVARAVLLIAPAGIGKSRLAYELLRTIRARGDPVEIWMGRGDSLHAGSAFALLGQALRGACGIRDGEPLAVRRDKLRACVERRAPAADRRRIAEFLGELVGTSLPDEDSAPLRAARQDAQLMGEQMRCAWEDFLRAETAHRPVLLVLENLHWGDRPTVRFIDSALRNLRDRPFMVLGLARPEIHELYPRLWADRSVQEIRVGELSRRASERLVRQVLGDRVGDQTAARIAAFSDGNAFYLEELIRAAAEGKGDALPETVVAMVEARLNGLPVEARRLLRAASVFGEVFWAGGVAALSDDPERPALAEAGLASLVDREVLVRRPEGRFPGEEELAFRHALLREGAYAMLTAADRVLGHRLAGEWLLERGESDPMVLAEHFARGDEPARAGSHYLRAVEQARRGGDPDAMVDRARRGLACGVPLEVKLPLLSLLSVAHASRGEWSDALAIGEEVLELTVPGSTDWMTTIAGRLQVQLNLGEVAPETALPMLRDDLPPPEAPAVFAQGCARVIFVLDTTGHVELATAGVRRLAAAIEPVAEREPVARAWLHMLFAYRDSWWQEDPEAGLRCAEIARAGFAEAGDTASVRIAELMVGMNLWFLGALEPAERTLRGALGGGYPEHGLAASIRTFCLAGVQADLGALAEARETAAWMLEIARTRKLSTHEARGRRAMADVLLRLGDLEAAEREARAAYERALRLPLDQAAATALLAAVLLAEGRAAEALAVAEEAMGRYQALGIFGFKGALARLVHAESLAAAGDRQAAAGALAAARARLLANAAKIDDPALRRSFLERVPENARTLALARAWRVESEAG